jgi:hypothetical protein
MEIVAHTLWATAAANAANRRKARIGLVWFAIWTMFPDLFAFSPEVIAGLWNRITGSASAHVLDFHHVGAQWGWLDVDLYDIGHSLIIFVAVFLVVWAILRRPLWEMLGWALQLRMSGSAPCNGYICGRLGPGCLHRRIHRAASQRYARYGAREDCTLDGAGSIRTGYPPDGGPHSAQWHPSRAWQGLQVT